MNRLEDLAIRHPLRVALLDALADGKRLELATYAKALDLSLPRVVYHCKALAAAGAVSLQDGVAQISESGGELHRAAEQPERRQGERRSGERRKGDRRQG